MEEGKRLEKKKARLAFKEKRRLLSSDERVDADRRIVQRILQSELYLHADRVLLYHPLWDEPDIRPVMFDALKKGKAVGLPRVENERGDMSFYSIEGENSLAPGSFHLLEPAPSCPKILDAHAYPLCFIPGIAFDAFGGRLGFGKGYYDRFLARFEGARAGVLYMVCMADKVPKEENDIPMHVLFTEQGMMTIAD